MDKLIILILINSLSQLYEDRITEYTTSNGMRFIIFEDHSSPVVSFHTHLDVGAADEEPGATGIAHLFEHLAFNGTEVIGTKNWRKERELLGRLDSLHNRLLKAEDGNLRREFEALQEEIVKYAKTNEFGQLLDKEGGVGPGAYTSHDYTCYWCELPSNRIELWASLESDRLFNTVLRGFYGELKVVMEERRMVTENRPWGRLWEEFRSIAYRLHPYKHPVIGYMEDLERMTRGKLKRFHRRYYLPQKMVVVIAGDVYPESIIPVLESYFGRFPKGDPPPPLDIVEPVQNSERRIRIELGSQPRLLLGYHIPDARSPDLPALKVLAEILGRGRGSRLYKRLVKQGVALYIGGGAQAQKCPALFYINAAPAGDHTVEEVAELIYEEIERIKEGPIQQDELERAKRRIAMEILRRLRTNRGRARLLAWYETVKGDWRELFRELEDIERVSEGDIKMVAAKYLHRLNRTMAVAEPKEGK